MIDECIAYTVFPSTLHCDFYFTNFPPYLLFLQTFAFSSFEFEFSMWIVLCMSTACILLALMRSQHLTLLYFSLYLVYSASHILHFVFAHICFTNLYYSVPSRKQFFCTLQVSLCAFSTVHCTKNSKSKLYEFISSRALHEEFEKQALRIDIAPCNHGKRTQLCNAVHAYMNLSLLQVSIAFLYQFRTTVEQISVHCTKAPANKCTALFLLTVHNTVCAKLSTNIVSRVPNVLL